MTVTEPLKAGSTISAFLDDVHIEGEVLCVDAPRKLLVIQASSSSGRRGTCDVILARMEFLRDIKTLKEGSAISFPELNINKVFSIPVACRCYPFQIAERISKNERIQQEKQKFYGPDVPPEARDLAEHIEKTLFDVVWDAPNIVVMEHSIISPPYTEGCVSCNSETPQAKSQADYVRKIVGRFHLDHPQENRPEK
ncbi:hypothetical protein P879_08922 [Paragonimus westermani]|uniref:AD domain-containing protein n=1 Tax=Paragonimus westermani TaxID=34504 RepID=A0A8T0DNE3_9TREM|nr:hypothetical protein P879_08922 [Paragonimus westermani]